MPTAALELIQAPSEEPVSIAEAREHLRLDAAPDDGLVTRLIVAARKWCEQQCGRAFVTQQWRLWMDAFPDGSPNASDRSNWAIVLPKPKLQSVQAVKYTDTSGIVQTLDPANYTVDAKRSPGRVLPAFGQNWPGARDDVNVVQVEFTCGDGSAAVVDERAKLAVLLLLAHWYTNREAFAIMSVPKELEMGVRALLDQIWDGTLA